MVGMVVWWYGGMVGVWWYGGVMVGMVVWWGGYGGGTEVLSNQAERLPTTGSGRPVKSWCPRPAIKLSHWSGLTEASDQALSLAESTAGEV